MEKQLIEKFKELMDYSRVAFGDFDKIDFSFKESGYLIIEIHLKDGVDIEISEDM